MARASQEAEAGVTEGELAMKPRSFSALAAAAAVSLVAALLVYSSSLPWSAGIVSGAPLFPALKDEAAKVDGANAWQRFRNVTIPMLSPYILFNLIIGLIGTMQIFAESFIMTVGGPDDSTLFYAYYLFKQAFQYFNMGYASALAWLLFIIILLLTWIATRATRKHVYYGGA